VAWGDLRSSCRTLAALFGGLAEFERELIRARTGEAIERRDRGETLTDERSPMHGGWASGGLIKGPHGRPARSGSHNKACRRSAGLYRGAARTGRSRSYGCSRSRWRPAMGTRSEWATTSACRSANAPAPRCNGHRAECRIAALRQTPQRSSTRKEGSTKGRPAIRGIPHPPSADRNPERRVADRRWSEGCQPLEGPICVRSSS